MNLLFSHSKSRCRAASTPSHSAGLLVLLKLLLAALAWWAVVGAAGAKGTDLWLISSRSAGCSFDPQHLKIYHDEHGCFVPQTWTQFLKRQRADLPLIVWVHGNRVAASEASGIGRRVFLALAQYSSRPFQMVIWSWPSAKQGGPLRDARIKAAAADRHGRHLARMLDVLPVGRHVGLLGYSYGARLILSALHESGAGEAAEQEKPGYQVVLWVPGVEHSALAPRGRFSQAWKRIDQVLLVTNCSDRVLRWYPWVCGPHGPEALGRVGPSGLSVSQQQRLRWIEASAEVGPRHDWTSMISTPAVLLPSVQLLLGDESAP